MTTKEITECLLIDDRRLIVSFDECVSRVSSRLFYVLYANTNIFLILV